MFQPLHYDVYDLCRNKVYYYYYYLTSTLHERTFQYIHKLMQLFPLHYRIQNNRTFQHLIKAYIAQETGQFVDQKPAHDESNKTRTST